MFTIRNVLMIPKVWIMDDYKWRNSITTIAIATGASFTNTNTVLLLLLLLLLLVLLLLLLFQLPVQLQIYCTYHLSSYFHSIMQDTMKVRIPPTAMAR